MAPSASLEQEGTQLNAGGEPFRPAYTADFVLLGFFWKQLSRFWGFFSYQPTTGFVLSTNKEKSLLGNEAVSQRQHLLRSQYLGRNPSEQVQHLVFYCQASRRLVADLS